MSWIKGDEFIYNINNKIKTFFVLLSATFPPIPPCDRISSWYSCKASCFRVLIVQFDADLRPVPVALGLALGALWFGRGRRGRGWRRLLHGHSSAQQRRALTRQEIRRRRQEVRLGRESERALTQDHAVLLGT